MPGGLSPNTAPLMKFESVAMSANYSNLSTTCWARNAAELGDLVPKPPAPYLGRCSTKFASRLIEPHQLRRIVLQHYFYFFQLDPEAQQRADEDAHAVDRIHVQHLAEIAADACRILISFLRLRRSRRRFPSKSQPLPTRGAFTQIQINKCPGRNPGFFGEFLEVVDRPLI
jgi:hypothetical protein